MFSRNKKWHLKPAKEKKEFKIPKRYWIYVVLIIAIFVGVIHILRLPEYQIRDVDVEGAVITREQDIKDITQEFFGYTYFYIIPQSNIWLYPKEKILERIRALTSVASVSVDLDNNGILHVYLKDKDNKYLICRTSNDECFYMNEEGYIFSKAPAVEGNAFLTFKTDSNDDLLGTYFLTKVKIENILNFISKLKILGLEVDIVDIKNDNEINLTLSGGTIFTVSLEKDLDDTIINIKTLLTSQEFMEKSGGLEKIDYIDLRYGKKAFWKMKAESEK
ncbi:MAG: hypothetical protein V4469_04625 [Patescibacteria group bacterium]